ncbi:MAG: cytochrome d ubiquinol oxidase subunit II [Candidatus Eisenbacteria bacterium]|uniref:Cytochrome d ubiquinol oxidase subunit II n=1 Tax=Eiseniibacteriota bacterium TaxID=2212470 RepID=A0A538S8X3_UNCEI|nr:MAG: cytochrome d ubiquinol oxidase subunit II [Candidatus Eisenbacteria bacterium]
MAVAQASRAAPEWERQNLLYAAITLAGGALAFLAFVVWSRLPTQPWYYLPLIALGSVSLDVLVGPLLRRPGARLASCAIILLVTVLHLPAAAPQLRVRQTNLDLVAADVGKNAGPGDLVIVTHWFFGITFHRYYSGHAPWMTIPPLEDTRIHRYDLLKRLMEHPEAVHSRVLEAISRTLMAGGRVFLVGGLPALSKGETPVPPPPAPAAGFGWDVHAYTDRWERLRCHRQDPLSITRKRRSTNYAAGNSRGCHSGSRATRRRAPCLAATPSSSSRACSFCPRACMPPAAPTVRRAQPGTWP